MRIIGSKKLYLNHKTIIKIFYDPCMSLTNLTWLGIQVPPTNAHKWFPLSNPFPRKSTSSHNLIVTHQFPIINITIRILFCYSSLSQLALLPSSSYQLDHTLSKTFNSVTKYSWGPQGPNYKISHTLWGRRYRTDQQETKRNKSPCPKKRYHTAIKNNKRVMARYKQETGCKLPRVEERSITSK